MSKKTYTIEKLDSKFHKVCYEADVDGEKKSWTHHLIEGVDEWFVRDPVKGDIVFYINDEGKLIIVVGTVNKGYTIADILLPLIPKYIPENLKGSILYFSGELPSDSNITTWGTYNPHD